MSPWLDFYRQIIAYFSPIPAEKISGHCAKNTSNQNNTIYISFKKYQTQTRNLICSLIDYQLTQTESFFKFPAIIF